MEWLEYIAPIVTGLTFVGVICGIIWNHIAHTTIRTNDLRHLESDIKKILAKQEETDKKIDKLDKDVSYLKGAHDMQLEVIKHLQH